MTFQIETYLMERCMTINSRFDFTSEDLRLYFRFGVRDLDDREESLAVLLLEDELESDDLRFRRLFLESDEDDELESDDLRLRGVLRILYRRL